MVNEVLRLLYRCMTFVFRRITRIFAINWRDWAALRSHRVNCSVSQDLTMTVSTGPVDTQSRTPGATNSSRATGELTKMILLQEKQIRSMRVIDYNHKEKCLISMMFSFMGSMCGRAYLPTFEYGVQIVTGNFAETHKFLQANSASATEKPEPILRRRNGQPRGPAEYRLAARRTRDVFERAARHCPRPCACHRASAAAFSRDLLSTFAVAVSRRPGAAPGWAVRPVAARADASSWSGRPAAPAGASGTCRSSSSRWRPRLPACRSR